MPKKYYWFKMPKNFYDRHDVKTIKRRLGLEALHCYMRLILESIDHEGKLRFSEKLPYDNESLAEAIDADYELFDKLFQLLLDKNMVEIEEDKTICIPFVTTRIGSESDSAARVRKHRKKKNELHSNVTNVNSNTEIEKELDIDIKKKNKVTFLEESNEYRFSMYLFSHIQKNDPKKKSPNYQNWAKEFDKILRIDKRDIEEVKEVIKYCQKNNFWKSNILSPKKLREKYTTLLIQMKEPKGKNNNNVTTGTDERDYEDDFYNQIESKMK